MSKKKNTFVGYTEEEVMASEAVNFIIQVGNGVLRVKGHYAFDKKSANLNYNKVLKEVLYQLQNGNKTQQESAKHILMNLKVLPLRIH